MLDPLVPMTTGEVQAAISLSLAATADEIEEALDNLAAAGMCESDRRGWTLTSSGTLARRRARARAAS